MENNPSKKSLKNVFLSVPMTGLSKNDIMHEITILKNMLFLIFNEGDFCLDMTDDNSGTELRFHYYIEELPLHLPNESSEQECRRIQLDHHANVIEAMKKCDIFVTLTEWNDSDVFTECNLELNLARQLDLKVINFSDLYSSCYRNVSCGLFKNIASVVDKYYEPRRKASDTICANGR